jgi:hypothetical protein
VAINIPIFSSLDTKGFDRAKKEFQSLEGFSAKAGFIVKKAMLPIAAAAGGVATSLGMAARAAAQDQASQAQLERQLITSTNATKTQISAVNDYISKTQLSLSVTDDLVRNGLGTLVRATRDTAQAQKLMNLALDISAATGKDAESVALALAKSYGGQLTALKKLGIPLDENIVKSKDFGAATKQLSDIFGGAAATKANTFQGKLEGLKIRFGEMVETIGYKVLPMLTSLVDKIARLADAFSQKGVAGAIREFRAQMQGLTRNTDGTINGFGRMIDQLITLRNAVAHVVNAFIRLSNLLPGKDTQTIKTIDHLTTNVAELEKAQMAYLKAANAQARLNSTMGPVASRDLQTLTDFQEAYKQSLIDSSYATDQLSDATGGAGGSTKKLVAKKKALKDAAAAAKEYAAALDAAIERVRDQFSPALKEANDRLAAAQGTYTDFYDGIYKGITGIMDIGAAWQQAADSEGAQTFFGVLKSQADKAQYLAANLEKLIAAGLDDPSLLQSIVNAGADTGIAISDAIIAGGAQGLADIKAWTDATGKAAARIAQLSADKWFKAGVSQAQSVVDGVNSVIADTEFALKFTINIEGADQLGAMFSSNVANVLAGGAATPMFNPADFSAAANMALGQPTSAMQTQTVNISVNGGDPNAVVDALRKYQRQNGAIPIAVSG